MRFYLFTDIQWDTEGQTLTECMLPVAVLLISGEDLGLEARSMILSESFGFNHSGFTCRQAFEPVVQLPAGGDVIILPSARSLS